jgi:single-strand DNA-binding protein
MPTPPDLTQRARRADSRGKRRQGRGLGDDRSCAGDDRGFNLVVLRGLLSRPATSRILGSGDVLVNLEVTVRSGTGPAEPVPVTVVPAPASVAGLDAGEEVVVLGRVRRRFFRSAGTTESRTEVVAETVASLRQASLVRRCLAEAGIRLARSVDQWGEASRRAR